MVAWIDGTGAIGITANLSIGGVLLDSKRQSGVFGRVGLEADLHNQRVVLKHLGKSGLAATFTPEQLTVQASTGEQIGVRGQRDAPCRTHEQLGPERPPIPRSSST